MMFRLSARETPFILAFRTKAVVPLELGLPSYKVHANDEYQKLEDHRANLDLLEEV